jgi:glycosyltransferase involved in cell wall biosynthesis
MIPSVSVVIPAHNAEKYIHDCLESVLTQSLKPAQIIVVDDGSTDRTPDIVAAAGSSIVYRRQSQAGPAAARNLGVSLASGVFLSFIDADDLWIPEKLALQVDYLLSRPEVSILFGMMQNFYSPDVDEDFKKRYACQEETLSGFHPGAMLLRRETFLQVGPFDANLKMGEFIEWHTRAKTLQLASHVLPALVLLRRIHASNYGITHKDLRKDYLTIVKGLLAKKKEAGP